MRNKLLLILLVALMPLGCSHPEIDNELDSAERLMEERPDSALKLLEAINGSDLRDEPRARHSLLLSQAYTKNYIDITDDSLISIAVRYYERTDDHYHQMLAYNYLGNVKLCAAQYGPALHAALNAHDRAVALADTMNLSRIESLLGRIYVMANDQKEGLRWDSMSLENAKRINNETWILNGYLNIAAEHMSMGEYIEALQYTDSAIAISGVPTPEILDYKYRSYFGLHMDDKADSILSVMYEMGITPPEDVNAVLDFFKERTLEEIIEYKDQVIRDLNEYIKEIFQGNLSASLTEYLDSKSRRLNEEIERKRRQNIMLSIFGVMSIVVLTLLVIVFRLRAKNQRIKNENAIHTLLDEYNRVKQEVESQQSEISGLQQGVDQLTIQVTEAQRSYMDLRQQAAVAFMQRFMWINKIGSLFIEAKLSGDNSERKLYRTIAAQLNHAKSMPFVDEIEKSCREHNKELWDEIGSYNLINSERQLLLLLISGVSTRVLCLITDKTPAAIYNLKSRVRNKLHAAGTPFANYLLTVL